MSDAATQPTIREFMSPEPLTLTLHDSVADAQALMNDKQIRHVPVLAGSRLVGVVSERDLRMLQAIPALNVRTLPLEEVTSSDVYHVAPDTPLRQVAEEMAEHKYGCALIVEGETLVGIFSTTDLGRAVVTLLDR